MHTTNLHFSDMAKKAVEASISGTAYTVLERKHREDNLRVPEGTALQDWDIQTAEFLREVLRQGPAFWKLPDPAWHYLGLGLAEYDSPPVLVNGVKLFGEMDDYRQRMTVKEAMNALA